MGCGAEDLGLLLVARYVARNRNVLQVPIGITVHKQLAVELA